MSDVDDMHAWLQARWDEDEAALRDWLANLPDGSGAADWIRQWLVDIDAKRRILEDADAADRRYQSERRADRVDPATVAVRTALVSAVASLAVPYADRDGYLEEWRP